MAPRLPVVAGALATLLPLLVAAQSSGGGYVLRRTAIDGGARSAAAAYVLVATTGQAASGPSQAGAFRITAGFHGPQGAAPDVLLRDGFE